jgi:creatinine amidohydrolase
MTVADVLRALEETRTVLLPSGGTEQHGYHLPLATDTIFAEEVAYEVSQRTGCLVAPPLNYSFSGGLLAGTTDVSPDTTTRLAVDLGRSLAEQGVRNLLLVVGHCGREHLEALEEAGYRLREYAPGLTVALCPIPSFSPTWREFAERESDHAGKGETSLMLYLRPHLVRAERPRDTDETKRPPRRKWVREEYVLGPRPAPHRPEAPYRYGVQGTDPNEATAELGRQMFEEMVAGVAALVARLEASVTDGEGSVCLLQQ